MSKENDDLIQRATTKTDIVSPERREDEKPVELMKVKEEAAPAEEVQKAFNCDLDI